MPTRALRTAASGMYAQQLNIEIISNNIANMNTTGFKKNKAEFQDLMYQDVRIHPVSSQTPGIYDSASEKIQVGNGVQTSSTSKLFKQGDLAPTNNPFDVGIQGEGFFQIRKPDGSFVYTRDGSFKVSSEGKIVTTSGYVLDPELTLDQDTLNIAIARDGTVEVHQAGGETFVLGNIELVRFMNPGGLNPIGENLYTETPVSGNPILGTPGTNGFGEVMQGFLESSNVDIVEEMITMISAQRAYEINSKTVKTVEEMMTMTNNLKRG